MITIYKSIEHELCTIPDPVVGSWLNVVQPTMEEISHLIELGIPHDYITYSLDVDERARSERENGEHLILLRVSYFEGESADIPYITIPLGIILTDHYIVTICRQENEVVQELMRLKDLSTVKRNRFVLRLLLRAATRYLTHLRQITKAVDALEDQLQLSTRNKEVLALLKYQKSLTLFTTALKSHELMMKRLQQSQIFRAFEEDEDLLEDVLTETQQAIEMTNISSNILSNMMDAFASIISNNLNTVMKFLASITIIVSLPTLITSFYGMNVKLPFDSQALAYLGILILVVVLTAAVGIIFWKQDWL
ncbi:MAG: magnesium transporter [Chloroflexi bacterium RBG_13_50_21]|nr:MAG: magnesium transporter [Chloroflexi bacterium RBG_13_50_21]